MLLACEQDLASFFPQCVLIEGYIVFLGYWNCTTLFWLLPYSCYLHLSHSDLVWNFQLEKDPIRSQKANLYQDSWIVGATAGWVKLIKCRPEISWKSANSIPFPSVQQKLSWNTSTNPWNTAGFERGNWPWILPTCPFLLKAGENSLLIGRVHKPSIRSWEWDSSNVDPQMASSHDFL